MWIIAASLLATFDPQTLQTPLTDDAALAFCRPGKGKVRVEQRWHPSASPCRRHDRIMLSWPEFFHLVGRPEAAQRYEDAARFASPLRVVKWSSAAGGVGALTVGVAQERHGFVAAGLTLLMLGIAAAVVESTVRHQALPPPEVLTSDLRDYNALLPESSKRVVRAATPRS